MSSAEATLSRVASTVLSDLCFYCADEGSGAGAGECATATIPFHGSWRGWFALSVERSLLGELTANLLGDEEASEADALSALLELTNVICGNVLPELESPDVVFDLGSPALGDGAFPAEAQPFASAELDGGRVRLRIAREVLR